MKILTYIGSSVTNLTMTNAHASYPKEYMLAKYQKKMAKATTPITTITFSSTKAMDLFVFNTNATSGHLTVVDNSDSSTVYDADIDLIVTNGTESMLANAYWQKEAFHIALDSVYEDISATLILETNIDAEVYIGALLCGFAHEAGTTQQNGTTLKPVDYDTKSIQSRHLSFRTSMGVSQFMELDQALKKNKGGLVAYTSTKDSTDAKDAYVLYGKVKISSVQARSADSVLANITIME